MLQQSISNPPLPPPAQPPVPAPLTTLRLPARPSTASIPTPHHHSQLELSSLGTHLPASAHHAEPHGAYANPHGQQYTLATRARMQEVERSRRAGARRRSRSPAGLVGTALNHPGHSASGRSGPLKTVNTDLTRYANSSSFRGTTPPQRLRYIYRPADDDPTAEFIPRSDGRYRSWEEVDYHAPQRPTPYTDERGREWLPVLSKNASADEWAQWEARERRRIAGLEARLREKALRGGYSERESERRWVDLQSRAHIHPWFLCHRDGSSFLLTPDGQRPMSLLDRGLPWPERQYHHVGRDPLANYQAIFGGLEAERERQARCDEEERVAEKDRQKAMRKEARDYERARRKEEKMRLRYELEVQKLAAEKARQVAAQGGTKVVKKIVHNADGTSSVVFVKRRVAGTATASATRSHHADRGRSPSHERPSHAPWGSSVAAQRNASRASTSHRQQAALLSPNAQQALAVLTPAERRALGIDPSRARSARPHSAQRNGWLNPDTRNASMQQQQNGNAPRHSSRSRSRSRSTSSSRRRAARRAEKAARAAAREERERKVRHAKHNSTETQAGPGTLPEGAAHPRASELEAHLLREAQQRKEMSIHRFGSTLNSLDKLSLGGVGSPQHRHRGGQDRDRPTHSRSLSSDSSSLSGSSSSSGFSSRDSSVASPRRRSRSRSRSSSRSRRRSRRHDKKHSKRSRSRSLSPHSRSRSRSHSRSPSSTSSRSRSGSRRRRHSKHGRHDSSSGRASGSGGVSRRGEWVRRGSFEEMDERVRGHAEAKWMRAWEKRYEQARTSGQKRALKEERSEWKARRRAQHTLLQNAHAESATDQYLQSPTAAAASPSSSSNAAGVLTDQYGTPISSYGTVYPQPVGGTLLQQASVLEQYSAQAARTDALLADSHAAVEATVAGIENIVDGLRVGYATKGTDAEAQQAEQRALQLSLRAAIRAREDRRKKSDAMARAHRHVLDELRRQEAVIMARGQDVSDSIQLQAYEQAAHAQMLRQQQLDEQRAMQQAALDEQRRRAARAASGSRGRGPNWQLGQVDGVDQFWYEHKDTTFTPNHVAYNSTLRAQLAQLPSQSP